MTASLIKARIDEATTSDNKWNFWPDKLEIVSIDPYDHQDPHAMYVFGQHLGTAMSRGAMRQVRYSEFGYSRDKELPGMGEIRRHIPGNGYNAHRSESSLISIWFTLAVARGQEDAKETRNLLVLFEPTSRYDSTFRETRLVDHGLIVEIGCKHDYDDAGSRHQRGYHLGRCRKCGHKFLCDSGD